MGEPSAAEILTEWKHRSGLSDEECAAWCELSVSAFRRQRSGKVTPARMRQTVKLARVHSLLDTDGWLKAAMAAAEVAKSLRRPT